MISTKMSIALPLFVALQALGVSAEGFADVELRNVVLPRSSAPALVGDAVNVLNGKRAIEARAAPDACTIVLGAISFCSSVSPGFLTFAPSRQAPCLCYSSTSWVAGLFDGYIASCASYAKTADPEDYSALSALGGFCSSVGNVRPASLSASATLSSSPSTTRAVTSGSASAAASSGTARSTTASPTITSKPATTTGTGLGVNAGCATVSKLLNSCVTATRGFTDIAVKSQAACLCYSSSSWVPNSFDNGVQTCAEYVKTADPTDYSVISALGGFCTAAGNVLAASATSVRTGNTVALTGGAISAATSLGGGNTVPLVITGVAAPSNTAAQTGPVTVTAGPAPTSTRLSGAGNLNIWDSMLLGIASVAIPAIIFL